MQAYYRFLHGLASLHWLNEQWEFYTQQKWYMCTVCSSWWNNSDCCLQPISTAYKVLKFFAIRDQTILGCQGPTTDSFMEFFFQQLQSIKNAWKRTITLMVSQHMYDRYLLGTAWKRTSCALKIGFKQSIWSLVVKKQIHWYTLGCISCG